MIDIKRKRYIIVSDDNKIFCGLARNYQMKPIDDIGNTSIKTYLSEQKAKSSFLSSWMFSKEEDFENGKYRVIEVTESIVETQ